MFIDIDTSDVEYNEGIHNFMENRKTPPNALHTWLIMLKSWQSIGRYLLPTMSAEGLGESDFRVLEVLLHKGPMPVNAIGPKMDLNPGSVSVAVDRLHKKGVRQPCRVQLRSADQNRIADGKRAENVRSSLSPTRCTHQTRVSGRLF